MASIRSLEKFFGVEDGPLSEEAIILLRLLGRPFLRPYDVNAGEPPEAALVDYLRQAGRQKGRLSSRPTDPFIRVIGTLIGLKAAGPIQDPIVAEVLGGIALRQTASLAVRLIRVVEESRLPVDRASLQATAARLNPTPLLDDASLAAYWKLLLSSFGRRHIADDQVPISMLAVQNPIFLRNALFPIASCRPSLFFNTVVPFLFSALSRASGPYAAPTRRREVMDILKRAIPVAFVALESSRRNASISSPDQTIEMLSKLLQVYARSDRMATFANLFVQGAADATASAIHAAGLNGNGIPFSDLVAIEAGYSRGRYDASRRYCDSRSATLDHVLDRLVDSMKADRQLIKEDPFLATNTIPYSEGLYFRIWRELIGRVGIRLEMRAIPWNSVVDALVSDEISFAIWNDFSPATWANQRVKFSKSPLLVYDGYPLVIRRTVVERLLERLPADEQESVIRVLVEGTAIPFNLFSQMSLRANLHQLKIGYVGNSDFEAVAKLALEPNLSRRWSPVAYSTSDVAIEHLVDNEIDGAIVGALQASYLERHFPDAFVLITMIERTTPVSLWFKSENYQNRSYGTFVPLLFKAWQVTRDVWAKATAQGQRNLQGQLLRRWIENLALELNLSAHSDSGLLTTPIRDWKELKALKERHDVLCEPVPPDQELTPALMENDESLASATQQLTDETPAALAEAAKSVTLH